MARRSNQLHPSVINRDAAVMSGYPEEGDEMHDEDEQGDGDEVAVREPSRTPDVLADLRRDMDLLKRENDLLKRSIPPVQPATPEAPAEEEEPDWNQLLFADPKGALELYGERVANRVKRELRAEYQQERGTQRFWEEFYQANGDLQDDHDLVEATMNKHMQDMLSMPATEAMTRLADLTRQRILKYSKRGGEPRRNRAVVEGASSPSFAPAAPADESNVTSLRSLSSLLKARRAKRRGAAA